MCSFYLDVLRYILTGTSDGRVIAERCNPAVSTELLTTILQWKESGATGDDCLKRLRLQMVPEGYSVEPWISGSIYTSSVEMFKIVNILGEEENDITMLRSILAQLEYAYQVKYWDNNGVPFRTYMYVPEVHPITKCEFHEREDFAHLLKVSDSFRMHDIVYYI